MNINGLDTFTRAYLVCALQASTDTFGDPIKGSESDISEETLQASASDCKDFQDSVPELMKQAFKIRGYTAEQAGHDFWLSRNGHGAGFFDRGNEPIWKILQVHAATYGSVDLYVGDDGQIYGA